MQITFLPKDTLKELVSRSIGSKLFQSAYAKVNGKKKEITEHGKLSCAFHVSTLLRMVGLVETVHTTVEGTLKDMQRSGWVETKKPKSGTVIVWETQHGHEHIGFSWGKGVAISNSTTKRYPVKHHETWQGKRKIVSIWEHPVLS